MSPGQIFYVWSPIRTADGVTKVGEEVTKEGLGVSDEDWDYFVESGSVRTKKYPVPDGVVKSPAQHVSDELAALTEGGYVPEDDDPVDDTPKDKK